VKQYFVTGTDTGVGKTTVACAILAAARARGLRVDAVKPVETGCRLTADGLYPADAAALARACFDDESKARALQVYRAPLAPSVAAELEGIPIDLEAMADAIRNLRQGGFDRPLHPPEFFLVEGAGGLLVPLTDTVDMAGLAASLELPLIIVARDGLGTINHTLLTLEAAERRNLTVAGVVLSAAIPGTSRTDAERNAVEISRRSGARFLGILPHQSHLAPETLARAAAAHLDLAALF